MKIAEVIIACALFVSIIGFLSFLLSGTSKSLSWMESYKKILTENESELDTLSLQLKKDFYGATSSKISNVDNFTKQIIVGTLSEIVTTTSESEGQNSCRPDQDKELWKNPKTVSADLSLFDSTISPSDIDVVGNYAYVASNSAIATSSDLFIFDISDPQKLSLVSKLDKGPGLAALTVAGNMVYGANTSVTNQLLVISAEDLFAPYVIASYKLPGLYTDSTTIGNAIFYKNKKIFLGTQKSQIKELHVIDVTDTSFPMEVDGYEIGNGINDIFAFRDKVYVASPNTEEVKVFSLYSDGRLYPFASYNDPGTTGNGKRLSLFLDTLYVGKTATFSGRELLALSASPPLEPRSVFSFGSSIQGLFGYQLLVFVLLHRSNDNFLIYDTSVSMPVRLNNAISLIALPLDFDCSQNTFAVIYEDSPFITLITHS